MLDQKQLQKLDTCTHLGCLVEQALLTLSKGGIGFFKGSIVFFHGVLLSSTNFLSPSKREVHLTTREILRGGFDLCFLFSPDFLGLR